MEQRRSLTPRRRAILRRHTRWVVALAVAGLAACRPTPQATSGPEPTEFDWARNALARNPNLEIVGADRQAELFTVRDRHTDRIHAIRLDELAATPIGTLLAAPERTEAAHAARSQEPHAAPSAQIEATATPDEHAAAAQTATNAAAETSDIGAYTIERNGGQLRVSGPGVSIVSAGSNVEGAAPTGTHRFVDPIICEGPRMMHLDNRQIRVDGDAITVRGGCELHVTNSRIVATGTAIVVQDGTLHIANSHIEGEVNSFSADERAKVFVRASTFVGIPRRAELAQIQDQGGNRWR